MLETMEIGTAKSTSLRCNFYTYVQHIKQIIVIFLFKKPTVSLKKSTVSPHGPYENIIVSSLWSHFACH